MAHMGMIREHLARYLPVFIHSMAGHSTAQSLAQVVEGFRGAEAAVEFLVAGEGFVGGKRINCMGAIDEARGSTNPEIYRFFPCVCVQGRPPRHSFQPVVCREGDDYAKRRRNRFSREWLSWKRNRYSEGRVRERQNGRDLGGCGSRGRVYLSKMRSDCSS